MIDDILGELKADIVKAHDGLKKALSKIRTGRANPALFQKISVEYYGTPTPLAQLASLANPEARTLIITPYDKGALKDIERAIVNFPNLGATPTNDGNIIRVTMPEMTEDRRKEFVKIVRAKAEDGRVAVRNIRRKGITDIEALKADVSEDDVARAEKEIDALTKSYIESIDEALKKKEAELLEV